MPNTQKKRKVAPAGCLARSKRSVSAPDNANDDADGFNAAAAADKECSASTSRSTLAAAAAPAAFPTAAKKRKAAAVENVDRSGSGSGGGLLTTSDATDGKYDLVIDPKDNAASSSSGAVDANAMVVGPALASLPSILQLGILSYCDVPSLNAMMNASPMFIRMAQSDEVWEGNLKRLLESVFDDAFGRWWSEEDKANPPTKISLRPDWRCSTTFRMWYDECERKGVPFGLGLATVKSNFVKYEIEIPKPAVIGGQRIWKTTTYAGSYLPEHHKWVWKDVKLMHYYRSAATFAAAGMSYRMRRAANANCCSCCFSPWSQHDMKPQCQGDRGLVSKIFNGLPLIRIFDVNAFDSYRFGCGDDLSYQMYNVYIAPPVVRYKPLAETTVD